MAEQVKGDMSESARKSTRSIWRNNGFFSTQARAAAQQDTSSEGKSTASAAFQHRSPTFASQSELTCRGGTRDFDEPSFGCKLSIAQHRADESTECKRADDVNNSRKSNQFARGGQQSKPPEDSLSSLAASGNYAADDHDDKHHQKQPRHESICEKFYRMARRRYFMSLLVLSAFVSACLLASVAISRSITTPDLDSDTSRDGRQEASLIANQAAEQFEVRSFELVDLIEHDRTFAYTKWQVKVRVPKSAPAYQQHSLAPNSIESASERKTNSAAESELRAFGSEQDERKDDQYQLIGTRAFVTDHMEAMAAGGRDLDAEKSRASSDFEVAVGSELDDPIQLAAAEMQIDSKSVNTTLVDCFMVDLDKRYGQKVALETRHRRVASTRRVNFKRMLEIITACRLLTWATLTGQMNSTTLLAPTKAAGTTTAIDATRTPLNEQSKLLTKREQPLEERRSLVAQVPMSGRHNLDELIKPVEKKSEQRQAPPQEPFGAIIDALLSWSRPPNVTAGSPPIAERRSGRQTGPRSMDGDEAQQIPITSAHSENSSAADEEAKRASYLNAGMSMISGIVPSTLWCGLGDRAANYSELGPEFMVDACCRAHDHCPIRLKPFTADYGLINWSMSTRSHCDCDLDFNECLTSINSTLSNVIKTLYFRFMGLQCIDLSAASQRLPPFAEAPTAVRV